MAVTDERVLAGQAQSYWIASTPETNFPAYTGELTVDVAILGGGFVGIITAYLMKEAGLKVAVIERARVVKGVTGHTTAKVTSLHTLIYDRLLSKFGQEKAQQYADANQAAIERIATLVSAKGIHCDFSRQSFYTFAETNEFREKIEKEVKAAERLRLPVSFEESLPIPVKIKGAVCFRNQAQFHPRKFLLALAERIPGEGCHVFEETRASGIEEGNPCTVATSRGELKARHVVVATNFPFHDRPGFYYARLTPLRSYAIGIKTNEPYPGGMYIGAEDTGYSFRAQPLDGSQLLIIGGGVHQTGHGGDTRAHYRELQEYARRTYNDPEIEYRWSTQDNVTLDKVPYIGRQTSGSRHIFLATGFGQWGMTTSVVAGMILTDMVQGQKNSWQDVFDPSRFKPDTSAAKDIITQGMNFIKHYTVPRVRGAPDISSLGRGEGSLVEVHGEKVAAYRDEDGKLYTLSPKCVHMGCIVTWNSAERSWDCPCHGSRYSYTGEAIHGPAIGGLEKKEVPE